MSTRTLGILAGVIGSTLGTWWFVRQNGRRGRQALDAGRERGTVIFDNTPTASTEEILP